MCCDCVKRFGLRRRSGVAVLRLDGRCGVRSTCHVGSLLANFLGLSVPRPPRWPYRCQINAEGCVMDCRGRCGHWQACFDAFVMCFPKTDSSLFLMYKLDTCSSQACHRPEPFRKSRDSPRSEAARHCRGPEKKSSASPSRRRLHTALQLSHNIADDFHFPHLTPIPYSRW